MPFEHPSPRGPLIAFVLFEDAPPALDALAAALTTEFGTVALAAAPVPGDDDPPASLVVVSLQGVAVLAVPAAEPAPGEPAATCHPTWWHGEASAVAAHRGHVLVTAVRHPESVIEHAEALTEAVALASVATIVAELPGAVAVYHTNGAITIPAGAYARLVRLSLDEGRLPVEAWTSVWLDTADDGVSGTTLGLDAFGHAELQVRGSERPASEVYQLLASVAAHLVGSGDRLSPGSFVGTTEDDSHLVSVADDDPSTLVLDA